MSTSDGHVSGDLHVDGKGIDMIKAPSPTKKKPSIPLEQPTGDNGSAVRSKTASPPFMQPQSPANSNLSNNRQTQLEPPATVPTSKLIEMANQAEQLVNMSLALNEPPVPLYLSEDMSHGHTIAVLAMLVRQIECAVETLETRMDVFKDDDGSGSSMDEQLSRGPERNDSKIDGEIFTDGALRGALEKVASGDCSALESGGFEWTSEHVFRALAAYANRLDDSKL
ncbi:hypothetical protein GGI07_005787 [Coemansia sp. Benny D115]|nr:hypothetical protein GGI07_005787 [Coemansia sp. Benny D115]